MRVVALDAPSGLLGVVSDTHSRGDVPAWLLEGFGGVDAILHAGDVVSPEVVRTLEAVAPVLVVRGNNDLWPWPEALVAEVRGKRIHLLHGHLGGGLTARERARRVRGADVVVYGHSHKAEATREGGVLYLNPGSPSRPRAGGPSAACLRFEGEGVEARLWGPR